MALKQKTIWRPILKLFMVFILFMCSASFKINLLRFANFLFSSEIIHLIYENLGWISSSMCETRSHLQHDTTYFQNTCIIQSLLSLEGKFKTRTFLKIFLLWRVVERYFVLLIPKYAKKNYLIIIWFYLFICRLVCRTTLLNPWRTMQEVERKRGLK